MAIDFIQKQNPNIFLTKSRSWGGGSVDTIKKYITDKPKFIVLLSGIQVLVLYQSGGKIYDQRSYTGVLTGNNEVIWTCSYFATLIENHFDGIFMVELMVVIHQHL